MVNYNREKANLEKISRFLDKMKIEYQFRDIKDNDTEAFPVIYANFQYEDIKFELKIRNIEDWIVTKCYILDFSSLPEDRVLDIFRLGLELNYTLPETTFSVFENEFYIESDMPLHGTFQDFQIEIHSIRMGIDDFMAAIGDETAIQEKLERLRLS